MIEQSSPTPHNGIAVKGCDCGGCFGESGWVQPVQSTPTPLEELVAMQLTSEFFIASDGHGSVGIRTDEEAAAIVIAAGWKSPAEVAKLVRAAENAWSKGYVHGYVVGSEEGATGVLVESVAPNPYSKPTTDTTEETNVQLQS